MPRPPVTRERLEEFLRRLGRGFRGPGRLYLVVGTQMVLDGFRAQTVDIDYAVDLRAEDQRAFSAALGRLVRELDINVEPAGPGEFIPLPRDWQARSSYVGRYGDLDVFTFDVVSTVLAKIERGTSRDIDDVLALVAAGRLRVPELVAAFEEIVPRLEAESVRVDEADFRRKFAAVLRLLGAQGGDTNAQP